MLVKCSKRLNQSRMSVYPMQPDNLRGRGMTYKRCLFVMYNITDIDKVLVEAMMPSYYDGGTKLLAVDSTEFVGALRTERNKRAEEEHERGAKNGISTYVSTPEEPVSPAPPVLQ